MKQRASRKYISLDAPTDFIIERYKRDKQTANDPTKDERRIEALKTLPWHKYSTETIDNLLRMHEDIINYDLIVRLLEYICRADDVVSEYDGYTFIEGSGRTFNPWALENAVNQEHSDYTSPNQWDHLNSMDEQDDSTGHEEENAQPNNDNQADGDDPEEENEEDEDENDEEDEQQDGNDDEEDVEDKVLEEAKEIADSNPMEGMQNAILIFLPGMREISILNDALLKHPRFSNTRRYWIIPVHSLLSKAAQSLAFRIPPPGVRKIVLSTNVAETGNVSTSDC
jgi:hypothetical protein